MYKKNPMFKEPENENARIWRYMDFTKLVSLLETGSLFFPNILKLREIDPFEGSFSKANDKLWPEIYDDELKKHQQFLQTTFRQYLRANAPFIVINCWHLSESESDAMWKLYVKGNEGIAIQSTFARLTKCFVTNERTPHSRQAKEIPVNISEVEYIDYETGWMAEGNMLYPIVHKRKGFEHERELRAFAQVHLDTRLLGNITSSDADVSAHSAVLEQIKEYGGVYFPINPTILIERVYISPTSPRWFKSLVESVISKYGMRFPVEQSALNAIPLE